MHNNGKYRHNRSNMIKLNNIGSTKLLHHHNIGHKSKIKVQDYDTITKELLPKVTLQKDPQRVTTRYLLHFTLVVRVSVEDCLCILVANQLKLLVLHVLVQRWCSHDQSIYLHTIIIGHDHLRSHLWVHWYRAMNRV